MPKKLVNFRLTPAALADLQFCMRVGKLRMKAVGYAAPSQSEIIEQALARLARDYRRLKVGQGVKASSASVLLDKGGGRAKSRSKAGPVAAGS